MPCLIIIPAAFFPRLIIVLLVIFSDYLGNAYQSWVWPLLGFFLLPYTTLAYAFAWHQTGGAVSGFYLVLIVVAVLADLAHLGGGGWRGRRWADSRRRREIA